MIEMCTYTRKSACNNSWSHISYRSFQTLFPPSLVGPCAIHHHHHQSWRSFSGFGESNLLLRSQTEKNKQLTVRTDVSSRLRRIRESTEIQGERLRLSCYAEGAVRGREQSPSAWSLSPPALPQLLDVQTGAGKEAKPLPVRREDRAPNLGQRMPKNQTSFFLFLLLLHLFLHLSVRY